MNNDNSAGRSFETAILPFLQCPVCSNALTYPHAKELKCINVSCVGFSNPFKIINGQPLLIDFDSGLFDKKNYSETPTGAVINRRKGGPGTFLKKLLWGASPVSKKQIDKLATHLERAGDHPDLLIVGGGTRGLGTEKIYDSPGIKCISFDVYISGNIDFVADAHYIPVKDNSMDAVIVQAVLEHVLDPQKVVAEIYRVLKPGGVVYAETPFMQQVHEGAYDFTRFTESGHRWLFKNFTLIDSGPVVGVGITLLWSIRSFFAGLFRSNAIGTLAAACFFWLRFFEKLVPAKANINGGSCFYFMGKKSDKPLPEKEIIAFYNRHG